MQAGEEQVRMPVVVVVAHGDPHAVIPSPGDPIDPGLAGDVDESAISLVAKEAVTRGDRSGVSARFRRLESPHGLRRSTALDAVDVEPAVAVEIDQAHAARERLGEDPLRCPAVLEDEAKAGRLGVVDELRRAAERRCGPSLDRATTTVPGRM